MKTKVTFESLEPPSLCSVTPLGVNLIVNGDFEASIGNVTADPAKVTEVTGWNTMRGRCAAIAYGTRGFPTASQAPANGGNNFLSGVSHPAIAIFSSQASQTIDVSSLSADVDAGRLRRRREARR